MSVYVSSMKAPIKDNIFIWSSNLESSNRTQYFNSFNSVLFWTIFFFWRQDCHHVVIWATHRSSPLLKVEPFMKIHVYEITHRWKFKSFCQEYVKISSSVNLAKDDVHWNDSIIEFHLQTWRDRAETSIKLILTEKVNYIRVTAEPKIIFLWNKYQRNK